MSILKNKDIYDSAQGNPLEPIEKYIDILESKVNKLKGSMKSLEGAIMQTNKTGSGSEAEKLIDNTERLKNETDKLTSIERERNKIQSQLASTQQKLIFLEDEQNKELTQMRLQLAEKNKEQKESIILSQKEGNEYKKLSIEYNRAAKSAKDLSIRYGENSKEAKQAAATAKQLGDRLKQIDASVGQYGRNVGNYTSALSKFGALVKNIFLGGALIAGIRQISLFAKEILDLGSQLTGTERAFNQLNRPDLLNRLREATGGTISDIELMKKVLDSDDFKQNLDNLPLYFAFARKEVQETGGNVDDMVQTIINGIGKESPKALTQLGIPLKEFKEEMKKTGDYTEALNNIITRRMKEAGTYIETAADATARWSARWNNFKASAGQILDKVIVKIAPALEDVWNWLNKLWKTSTEFIVDFINGWIELYNESIIFRSVIETIGIAFKIVWNTVKLFFSLMIDNLKNVGSTLAYTFNPKNWGKGFSEGLAKVMSDGGKRIADDFKEFGKDAYNAFVDGANDVRNGKRSLITAKDLAFGGSGTFQGSGADGDGGGGGVGQQAIQKEVNTELEAIETIDSKRAELQQNNLNRLAEYAQAESDARAESLQKEQAFLEQRNLLIAESLEKSGESFGRLLTMGELSYKEFGKFLLNTALDIAEKMILLAIAEITAREIASKSFAGIATAAVLTGLIKGIFSGIKAQVQQFATGTEYVNGQGSETSDSIPAMLSRGERVIPASINKQLLGIKNKDLPAIIHSGMNSMRLEMLMSEVRENTSKTAFYLQHGKSQWSESGWTFIQDWNNGIIRQSKRND